MSSVWQTQHRLFREWLHDLAGWLSDEEPPAPAIVEEQAVRLLAVAVLLIHQHQVNKRGQCRFCGWARWTWRWRRRRRCTVHQALGFALGQSLEVVWWQVLDSIGRPRNLTQVREWVQARTAHTTASGRTAQDQDGGEPTIPFGNQVEDDQE